MAEVRVVISIIAGLGMIVAVMFWPAGRLDWTAGWLISLRIERRAFFVLSGCIRHPNITAQMLD